MFGSIQTLAVGAMSLSLIVANGSLMADRRGDEVTSPQQGPLPAQVMSAEISIDSQISVKMDSRALQVLGGFDTPGFGQTPSEVIEASMDISAEGTVVFPDKIQVAGTMRFKINSEDLPLEIPENLRFQMILIGEDAWMTAEGLDGWVRTEAGDLPPWRLPRGKIPQALAKMVEHPIKRASVDGPDGARIGEFRPVRSKPGKLSGFIESGGKLSIRVGLDDGYHRSVSIQAKLDEGRFPISFKVAMTGAMTNFSSEAPKIERPSKVIGSEEARRQLGVPFF
ncbi:MAG: hypothetical protein ACLGH3_04985 [Actinomycetota bacterium]